MESYNNIANNYSRALAARPRPTPTPTPTPTSTSTPQPGGRTTATGKIVDMHACIDSTNHTRLTQVWRGQGTGPKRQSQLNADHVEKGRVRISAAPSTAGIIIFPPKYYEIQ
jgi:hypothetical protein